MPSIPLLIHLNENLNVISYMALPPSRNWRSFCWLWRLNINDMYSSFTIMYTNGWSGNLYQSLKIVLYFTIHSICPGSCPCITFPQAKKYNNQFSVFEWILTWISTNPSVVRAVYNLQLVNLNPSILINNTPRVMYGRWSGYHDFTDEAN